MDNLLPPIPLHLATLGLLDNEIGIATLGYVVGPPIVPRFPSQATVTSDQLIGSIYESGELTFQLESCDLKSAFDVSLDLEGFVEGLVWRAAYEEVDYGGDVDAGKLYGCSVMEEEESKAEIEERGDMCVEISEDDKVAEVNDCDQVAVVKERPGEGRCKS